MADALLSPAVALTASAAATVLIVTAGMKIKKSGNENMVPLMGVLGAFVFAAQMVNFTIPGTGSSGHIVGGVLLAALLGPWAAFLTLTSVLIIQCLIFADGGLMALGCNILNMAAMTCLVAYPLIYKPLRGSAGGSWRMMGVSLLACTVGLELGAVMVSVETALSGVTALPFGEFLALMTAIHLAIGVGEGLATGAVLIFVKKAEPGLLYERDRRAHHRQAMRKSVIWFAVAALAIGGGLAFLASSNPDGLEWSIQRILGTTEPAGAVSAVADAAGAVQASTSFLPDYENSFSGIIGALMVVALVWSFAYLLTARRKRVKA